MNRRRMIGLGAAALGLSIAPRIAGARTAAGGASASLRWGIDYSATTDPVVARQFGLLVLEPHHARPIAPLRAPGAKLLGYVSFGEVERGRPYLDALATAGVLAASNPNWPDARLVDLRRREWRDLLLDRAIPDILALGYDGIFIDTLDNAEAMERTDPVGNAGMVAAGAALLQAVRQRFPMIRIMLNRGYAVAPAAAGAFDILLGEAMGSRWNFAERRYELTTDSDFAWQADRLLAARRADPSLVLTTLDYWDPADRGQVARLYARSRAAGFAPYVATLALDRLLPEARS